MEDTSVMPRKESGVFGLPFFLYIRRMIPKVQHSGITPLSSILLNSSTYNSRNKCMVDFIYSFTTISYPGAFPFSIYLAAKRTSFSVILPFKISSTNSSSQSGSSKLVSLISLSVFKFLNIHITH